MSEPLDQAWRKSEAHWMSKYAQPLRAIGQALEVLRVENFYLEPDGDGFMVGGQLPLATSAATATTEEGAVRHIWGLLPGQKVLQLEQLNLSAMRRIDLRYSPKDIERLEVKGQAQRVDRNGLADGTSLPQLLRTIGEYLNQKEVRLLRISKVRASVTVEYETASGQRAEQRLAVADLSHLAARMYAKRAAFTLH